MRAARLVTLGPILAAMVLLSPVAARAEDLVFSLWLSPTHPNTLAAKAWAERLEETVQGRLKIRIAAGGELGPSDTHLGLAASGRADIAHVSIGAESPRLPVAAVALTPLLVTQAVGGTRAFDSWYRRHAGPELKGVRLCIAFMHNPGALHTRQKVIQPEQARGLRLRVPNAVMARYATMLGALPSVVPTAATYDAFRQDGLDAIAFPWGSLFHYGLDRKFRHHLELPLYSAAFLWVVNERRYRALPPDLGRALDRQCTTEEGARIADGWERIEAAGYERARITGDQMLHRPDPQDLAGWRRPSELLRREWIEAMRARRLDGQAMWDELQAALVEHDAAF